MNLSSKKITKATVKSFIKKNRENLFINLESRFDGMTDGCEQQNGGFEEAEATERNVDHTLGLNKAWFVGQSRDYFTYYNDGRFEGIEVSNSCGLFIVAVRIEEKPVSEVILGKLDEEGEVELETEDSMLTIRFRKFFGTEKEYNFQLNAKAVDGCKSRSTATKKIEHWINQGFKIAA